jgi:hypothetical protein
VERIDEAGAVNGVAAPTFTDERGPVAAFIVGHVFVLLLLLGVLWPTGHVPEQPASPPGGAPSESPAPDDGDGDDSEVPSLDQTSQGRAPHDLEQLRARRATQSGCRMHPSMSAPVPVRMPS